MSRGRGENTKHQLVDAHGERSALNRSAYACTIVLQSEGTNKMPECLTTSVVGRLKHNQNASFSVFTRLMLLQLLTAARLQVRDRPNLEYFLPSCVHESATPFFFMVVRSDLKL